MSKSQIYSFLNIKKSKDALINEMNKIFKSASDDQIELIYKIVKAINF